MDPGQTKLTAQLSGIVSKVIRQCLLALAEPANSSSSSCGQCHQADGQGVESTALKSAGYLCRELQGDLKYILAFNSPRVRGAPLLLPRTNCSFEERSLSQSAYMRCCLFLPPAVPTGCSACNDMPQGVCHLHCCLCILLLLQLALEWCLLVQEVMLWQDWPPALFDKQPASERRNPLARVSTIATAGTAAAAAAAAAAAVGATGAEAATAARSGPLFRGPRMK
jgi:cytochrome c553